MTTLPGTSSSKADKEPLGARHTPGPWTFALIAGDTFRIEAADGRSPATVSGSENARLIAAAPELLEALVLAEHYLRHPDVQAIPFARPAESVSDLAWATIANATGG